MLILEKVIKLLDDFHFDALYNHVKNISKRSYFPLVLIEAIERDIDKSQKIEHLCMSVYGEFDEKIRKKFLQLAHYTFKLVSFLSKNYPDFLQSNLSKIHGYINTGELKKANLLADTLFEISRKIEDYSTESKLLQMQAQQNYLLESGYFALKQQDRIKELLHHQLDLNELIGYVFEHFDPKSKYDKDKITEHFQFFERFEDHSSTAISLISRYYKIYTKFQFQREVFFAGTTFQDLLNLEKDFQKNDYIIFPYLTDYQYSLNYLILEYKYRLRGGNEVLKETDRLIKQSEYTLFWNSFINLPELNSIELQSNFYYRLFLPEVLNESIDFIPIEMKGAIGLLQERCTVLLKNEVLEQMFILQFINLSRINGQLMVFGTKEDKIEITDNLESILYMYQQVPFHTQVVGVFNVLIVSYFLLENHEKVDEVYKRFKRIAKDKLVNEEDTLFINGFFYTSKWLDTKRQQYAQKLNLVRLAAQKGKYSNLIKIFDALSNRVQTFAG